MFLEKSTQSAAYYSQRVESDLTAIQLLLQKVQAQHAALIPNLILTLLEEPNQKVRAGARLDAERKLEAHFSNFAMIITKLELLYREILEADYWELSTKYSRFALKTVASPHSYTDDTVLKREVVLSLQKPAKAMGLEFIKELAKYIETWQAYRLNEVLAEREMWQPVGTIIRTLDRLVEARMIELERPFVQSMVEQLLASEASFDNLLSYLQDYGDENAVAQILKIIEVSPRSFNKLNIGWFRLFRNKVDLQLLQYALNAERARQNNTELHTDSYAEQFIVELETAAAYDLRNAYYVESFSPLLAYSIGRINLHLAYCVAQAYVGIQTNSIIDYLTRFPTHSEEAVTQEVLQL